MNESTVIHSTIRDKKGKSAVKKQRKEGFIPAIVYGHNFTSLKLSVNASEISKMFKLGHEDSEDYRLYKLVIDNQGDVKDTTVILKEIQRHPLTESIFHIDFLAVKMDEEIVAPVHIRLVGKSLGEKAGGILRHILREIDVKSLPANIPPHFDVDVTQLEIGDSLHIRDLQVADNIQILGDLNAPIASVLAPTVHKEEVEEEEAAEEEVEEVAEKASTESDSKE